MVYLMMKDGTYKEVEEATTARVEGGLVICRSIQGIIVAQFLTPTVTAYGKHEALRDPNRVMQNA